MERLQDNEGELSMNIMKMKKKDFESLPHRRWNEDIGKFDSLIIVPQRRKHESGYMCMDFIAVKDGEPICWLAGYSDVIYIDGIGGYGKWDGERVIPSLVLPKSWSIDCLPCGYLRLFVSTNNSTLTCGNAVSSFEVWAERRAENG